MKKILTLALVYQPPKILLGMKKRGFGAGRWNGFGGKLKDEETIEEAVEREMKEEVGIIPENFEKAGIISFQFEKNKNEILEVHFFKISRFSSKPRESEEMSPKWFDIKEIPYQQMWPDDKYWLPMFLENKKFKGKFLFGGADKILNYHLQEVKTI